MRAELSRVLEVQADRIRSMPLSRLDRAHDGTCGTVARIPVTGMTRADVVRTTAQVLADLAADVEGRRHRALPHLALHGLGDQLAVVGHDLVDHGNQAAWAAGRDALVELRRAL